MQDLSAKMDTLDDKLASMSTIQSRFDALDNKLSQITSISKEPIVSDDLNRYIERLDSIEESINDKIRNISSANPHQNISEHISKLESLCTQLNRKLDFTSANHNSLSIPPSQVSHASRSTNCTPILNHALS